MPSASAPGPATERIVVLSEGETFSPLEDCRVYEVPAEWGTEEIEEALAEAVTDLVNRSLGRAPSERRRTEELIGVLRPAA